MSHAWLTNRLLWHQEPCQSAYSAYTVSTIKVLQLKRFNTVVNKNRGGSEMRLETIILYYKHGLRILYLYFPCNFCKK